MSSGNKLCGSGLLPLEAASTYKDAATAWQFNVSVLRNHDSLKEVLAI